MSRVNELQAKLEDIEDRIDSFELDPDDYRDEFDAFLDIDGKIVVCGLAFDPSRILKELEPIAYDQALLAYALGFEDNKAYKELLDEKEEVEDAIADFEEEEED
jgi:hypothetical protein